MLQTTGLSDFRAACDEAIRGAQDRAKALGHGLQGITPEPKGGEKTKRVPFGFDVDRGRRLIANESALMKRMNDVAQNATHALSWCVSHDVPVLGILPEDVWVKICASRQLFTLWMDRDGTVKASHVALNKARKEVSDRVSDKGWFGGQRSYETMKLLRARAERVATQRFFERRNRISLMLDLFPDFGQAGHRHDWQDPKVPVRFPEPPEEFAKALLKLDGLRQQIAVVVEAGAISLDQYVTELLAEMDTEIAELEGQRREARREAVRRFFSFSEPDPILTFKISFSDHDAGPVRVIVAQYGKWPLELAAVKQAIQEDLRQPVAD